MLGANATGKMSARRPQSQTDEVKVRSDGLSTAGAIGAARERAAQRAAQSAHERANPTCNGETHTTDAVTLERRKLRAKVVNP
jgi:hypothetical protein